MKKKDITEFFRRLQERDPQPKGELDYTNPYTLLVAVALSAQATDVGVNKATRALFQVIKTPQDMLDLGEENLKSYIKTIGLYNTKARNIIKAAQMLVDDFDGTVPEVREELEKLAGVGRKTANVVLNIAFGQPTIAVDTHLFRVGNRTGMAVGRTPLAVEKKLERVIPPQFMRHAHHWLILHGRYICKARRPSCPTCPVEDLCPYRDKTVVDPLRKE